MPLVEISLWPGRDDSTKAELIRAVTEAVSRTTGAATDVVEVIIREVPKTDWAMGGKPFSKTHP
ncbi:MAG: 4-oxalocrotonate tautomerase [Candidatus Eisenbacteria bacterium]|nr:4-oxalocrotonate tautomerase [Candidatus Eisenbacteria bacterium]